MRVFDFRLSLKAKGRVGRVSRLASSSRITQTGLRSGSVCAVRRSRRKSSHRLTRGRRISRVWGIVVRNTQPDRRSAHPVADHFDFRREGSRLRALLTRSSTANTPLRCCGAFFATMASSGVPATRLSISGSGRAIQSQRSLGLG